MTKRLYSVEWNRTIIVLMLKLPQHLESHHSSVHNNFHVSSKAVIKWTELENHFLTLKLPSASLWKAKQFLCYLRIQMFWKGMRTKDNSKINLEELLKSNWNKALTSKLQLITINCRMLMPRRRHSMYALN